jgi:hypothetical protein
LGVFVDFFPPKNETVEGWVMVEPLADKPSNTSVDAWLAYISGRANLNPHIREKKLTLNGQPALKVRYHTADGEEVAAVYVVAGSDTFSVTFSGEKPGAPLEEFGNFVTYLRMPETFRVRAHPVPFEGMQAD